MTKFSSQLQDFIGDLKKRLPPPKQDGDWESVCKLMLPMLRATTQALSKEGYQAFVQSDDDAQTITFGTQLNGTKKTFNMLLDHGQLLIAEHGRVPHMSFGTKILTEPIITTMILRLLIYSAYGQRV